ncbi:MAG: hypothetical protein WAS55_07845 [Saprospiraceae bacterium]
MDLWNSVFWPLQVTSKPNYQESYFENSCNFGVKSKALLTTRFKNFDHFKTVVSITYKQDLCNVDSNKSCNSAVNLIYFSNGERISRTMTSGVNQGDLISIQNADYWTQLKFVLSNPYAIRQRKALERIHILSRRRADIYGSKDVAFFDLAEASVRHINTPNLAFLSVQDSLEKGYLNTFNHVTAQAIISSFFSEDLADLIGDLHERFYLPELTTGNFKESQLTDSINNPTDNYVDIINNEIGQKIGKALKDNYKINEKTRCTPIFLASYLNSIQSYYTWSLELGMDNFRPTDEVVIKFSKKLNALLER